MAVSRLLILPLLLLFGPLSAQVSSYSPSDKVAGTQDWQYSQYREYLWDTDAMEWDTIWQSFYTYSGGVLPPTGIVNQLWSNGFSNTSRIAQTFSPEGWLVEQFIEAWSLGNWENDQHILKAYDTEGNITSDIYLQWNGSSWDTAGFYNYNLTYDSQNRLTRREEMQYVSGQWENINATVWTYGSGPEWESRLELTGTQTGWDSLFIVHSIVWRDFEKMQYDSRESDLWINGQRSPNLQQTRTYGVNDSYEELSLRYHVSSFDTSSRLQYSYNAMGDLTAYSNYSYDTLTGTWNLFIEQSFANSYDGNDNLIEGISSGRYNTTDTLQPEFRYELIGYVLDADAAVPLEDHLAWASHPVGQTGKLVVDVREAGMLTVEVLDLEGRVLKTISTPHRGGKQAHTFDLGLPSGLYLYRVRLDGRGHSGKLLVK